jgi:hypothetical protein
MSYTIDEIKGFERERNAIVEKLSSLRLALTVESNAVTKFAYEYEIRDLENRKQEIEKIRKEAYQLGTPIGNERLGEKVRELKNYEPMGTFHLVNCNRRRVRDSFEEAFYRLKKMQAANHFYFLSACPKQLPCSFVERMVHELLREQIDDGKNPVHFHTDLHNNQRMKFKKLRLGFSEERSQAFFEEDCDSWFGWEKKLSLAQAIAANRLPRARCEYSILPLKLDKKDWKSFFANHFEWMVQQLAARPAGGPTLLVFIVLQIDDLHVGYEKKVETIRDETTGELKESVIESFGDENSEEIIQTINALCQKHPNAEHYYPLLPVEESELVSWINDLGEMNRARIQPVLDTIVEGLTHEELVQYQEIKSTEANRPTPAQPEQKKLLNMDRIELVQELVFDLYINRK